MLAEGLVYGHASHTTCLPNFSKAVHSVVMRACRGKGHSITIAIGGATESLYASPGTMNLVLRRRTGFVRVALQTGASLVPVIHFGENELYDTIRGSSTSGLRRFQMCAPSTSVPAVLLPAFSSVCMFENVFISLFCLTLSSLVGSYLGTM